MKTPLFKTVFALFISVPGLIPMVCQTSNVSNIKEQVVTYQSGGTTYKSFVAFDESIEGKRPAILVVPEWWGLNDYVKMRARELAKLGYIAMAVDVFGNGRIAADPKEAKEYTMPFYQDPQTGKARLDAAAARLKEFPQADAGNMAAIGYCFGGFVALNYAKQGAGLKAIVSFHGGLGGVPADKTLLKAEILVCHGAADKLVTEKDVETFKHQMDSIGALYTVKDYAGATHAFSNPDATRLGKEFNLPLTYSPEADKASWNDMKVFLNRIFGK